MKDHKVNGVVPTPEGVYIALNDNFGKNIIAQISGKIKGGTISLGDTISFDWKACGCGMAINKTKEIEIALTVIVGRSRDKKNIKEDRRNFLYIYYAEFLKRYRPLCFVFENVTGLLSAKDKNGNYYFNTMRNMFRKRTFVIFQYYQSIKT